MTSIPIKKSFINYWNLVAKIQIIVLVMLHEDQLIVRMARWVKHANSTQSSALFALDSVWSK